MRLSDRSLSRRAFIRGSAAAAAASGAALVLGCGNSPPTPTRTAPPATAAPPSPAATQATAAARWSSVVASGNGPSARRDHSLTYSPSEGVLYVFGGRHGGESVNELWVFHVRERAWERREVRGPSPEARFGHVAHYDVHEKRLVIALGQGNGSAFFNDVWAFDGTGWTQLATGEGAPATRYGSGVAYDAAGGRLLISHGFTDQGRFDDTWAFGLNSNMWSRISTAGDAPIRRCLTRCAWHAASQSMLLFGGQTDTAPFLGDFWQLDVAGGVWEQRALPVLPAPRNLFGSALDETGAHWYITSGNTPDGPTPETWVYDLVDGTWSLIGVSVSPPARYSADAAYAGAELYLFGGHDGRVELDDLWMLSSDPT